MDKYQAVAIMGVLGILAAVIGASIMGFAYGYNLGTESGNRQASASLTILKRDAQVQAAREDAHVAFDQLEAVMKELEACQNQLSLNRDISGSSPP